MNEVISALNFVGSYAAFKDAIRLHGYVVTRMIVKTGTQVRVWGRKQHRLTPSELKRIDRWLGTDHYTQSGIIRLIRISGIAPIRDYNDFANLLFRNGYSWQYTLITVEQEREEANKEDEE